jgi:uncharacterized Tic20 family protein
MTDPIESGPTLKPDSKTWAILAHLIPLVGLGFIAPLVIYLIKKDDDPFVAHHAREALNFQITVIIALIISAILILVFIGILLLIAVGIASLVFAILAAVAASNEQMYEYPISIRLVT